MRLLDLIYFDAGGGHRASATALQSILEERGEWQPRMINLRAMMDPQDHLFRLNIEKTYNRITARGWPFGMADISLRHLQRAIRILHRPMVRRLRRHWQTARPDMAVSLIPNFNRALHDGLRSVDASIPYVTLLTDIADFPPHFWMEPGQKQDFICGSRRAVRQARALGYDDDAIHVASGMILRPDFYRSAVMDRAAERRKLGLDPVRPTGLVLFGGQGAHEMMDIARRLGDVQLIMACGHNARLAAGLRALPSAAPRAVLGFTGDMPHYMSLADFFIGKPGPGSLSEALHMHLPVIVSCNRRTLPQERYNAEWVREKDVGLVLDDFRGIAAAVASLLNDLPRYRANAGRIDNRALFEIPQILDAILERRSAYGYCNPAIPGAVASG